MAIESNVSPASKLLGLSLDGGWSVSEALPKKPGQTGGFFSFGYVVRRGNESGFLKALDFSSAFQQPDAAKALQPMVEAYNFEREVLDRAKAMDRVVTAIDYGTIAIQGEVFPVQYIIFELAKGDVRLAMDSAKSISASWRLKMLQQTATGLMQLHAAGIAHQDLKPSNVLVFDGRDISKIADMGRSAYRGHAAPHDELPVPGAASYAPPELLYGDVSPAWDVRRRASDLYQLGSMLAFVFASITMTAATLIRMPQPLWPRIFPGGAWGGPYRVILPQVRAAFDEAVLEIADAFPQEFAEELSSLLRYLCDPDPLLRGHPKDRSGGGNPYALQRFVTRFDLLSQRARLNARG
jgi:serine/threonine protein kinase